MAEVVASIRRVTDIMGEISAASVQQNAGVAQIGEAVGQMDQSTQQNAALVEEMAKDGMMKKDMTMQECKDHMAMAKKDGMKKDDAMMKKDSGMKKDDPMMKKDEPMKK